LQPVTAFASPNAVGVSRRKESNKKATPRVCGVTLRNSVDDEVVRNIMMCNNLMMECVRWLDTAKGVDATDEAQRIVLLNLGRCLSEAVYGMLVLFNHGARGAVLILERATIEYYGRASYLVKEPEHALWLVEVDRLQARLDNDPATDDERTALARQIAQARKRNPHLTPEARVAAGKEPFHKMRIVDMIRIGVGEAMAQRYASASAVLHGDLYTTDILGPQPAQALNAGVVEAASGVVAFCNLMLAWLPREPKGLTERVLIAEEETAALAARYGSAHLIANA
jgi:hypothetical protein